MSSARREHTITQLFDGTVLAAGGLSGTPLASSESYAGVSTFANGATMFKARFGHRATRLPDGRVLVTGGKGATTSGAIGTSIRDAELYNGPAYTGTAPPPAEP